MNAKKIMGAVLVALLAAALLVGAGAAAANNLEGGEVVFVYQPFTNDQGTWVNGANTITFEAAQQGGSTVYAIMGTDIIEGEYKQGEKSIIVKYPTAVITGVAGDSVKYSFIGGNIYTDDVENNKYSITNATGVSGLEAKGYLYTGTNGVPTTVAPSFTDAGEYKIQVYFEASQFVDGMPENYLYGTVYTFNVVKAGEATVAADVDTILLGDVIKLTITAKPGTIIELDTDAFEPVAGQLNVNGDGTITVPNTGKVTVAIKAVDGAKPGDETITVIDKTASKSYEVDITIEKGTITAAADATSYFVGDKITITGTTTAGTIDGMTFVGTNFEADPFFSNSLVLDWEKEGKNFEFTIDTSYVLDGSKKLDVGTYTITLLVGANLEKPTAKATVSVALKQPFISIIEAPEVVVKGKDAQFIVNAEATDKIRYYVFGTNYFNASEDVKTLVDEEIKNQFKFTLEDEQTALMGAGQYFMVIQHPMYDGAFNITAEGESIYLGDVELFDVYDRQTANAAQALCDALDSQNIDDMYVKYSFFVVGEDESFTISDIPSKIEKGTTLTISGVSTANADAYVTVEMISTAFAAVPKETVGSAAFIAVTTQIAEDGTWEVTFDTSDLNVDEYSLKVACEGATWKNVNIDVVEAKPDNPVNPEQPEEPEQPEQPEEPVAPATPGFGALAALAGLGAVAVLLLRRE